MRGGALMPAARGAPGRSARLAGVYSSALVFPSDGPCVRHDCASQLHIAAGMTGACLRGGGGAAARGLRVRPAGSRPVLILEGAGAAGAGVVRDLLGSAKTGCSPEGFPGAGAGAPAARQASQPAGALTSGASGGPAPSRSACAAKPRSRVSQPLDMPSEERFGLRCCEAARRRYRRADT